MQIVATAPFTPLQAEAGLGFTIEDFVKAFHSDLSGHIHHAYADPTQPVWNQWIPRACQSLEEFGKQITFSHSEYMTFNSTYYKNRKVKFQSKFNKSTVYNVHELNAFVIDIDIYSEKALYRNDVKLFFDTLHSMVGTGIIPQYSFVVNSGNGFYVIWQIEKIRLSRGKDMKKKVDETLAIYEAIQRHLISLFKNFGADGQCVDPLHVYGIPGTYNCKNGQRKKRHIVEYHEDSILTMKEIRQEYLPKEIDDDLFKKFYPAFDEVKTPKKEKKKKKQTKKLQKKEKPTRHKSASRRFNTFDKHKLIISDLKKLVQLRKGKEMIGSRDLISLMIRYSYGIINNDQVAVEEMLRVNAQFKDPIDPEVLKEQTKYTVQAVEDFKAGKVVRYQNKLRRAGYNYSKRTIIKLLDIKDHEQEQLDYLIDPSLTYEIKKKKKRESVRDDYGLTKRDRQVLDTFIKVQEFKKQGFSQSQVAEEAGINIRTVKRNWNMPSGKNSEAIFVVYDEIVSVENETEIQADHHLKVAKLNGDTKSSCYVKEGVQSSLSLIPLGRNPLVIDDGSIEFLASQVEEVSPEFLNDSIDPDDSQFKCLIPFKTIYSVTGESLDIAYGDTIRVYDVDGNLLWRDPRFFKRI